MYVSLSDIISAIVSLIVILLGVFLLFLKIVNWRIRQNKRKKDAQLHGDNTE
jgi:heme/copper-type cytochrome/quinol oxidase subunit 2